VLTTDHTSHLTARLRQDVDLDAGRLPAYLFNDEEVYRHELKAIFGRCWQGVGHVSEVPDPGDYVTRYLGADPVVMVRGEDGQVRVLLNVCMHRGMRVCRSELGNASHFRCPYHGWTYRNSGELTGVPYQELAYGDTLDRRTIRLRQARVAEYGGVVFATWDERAPDLEDYLGDARWYLDFYVNRAEMEVFGPPQRWEMPCNWKIPAENFASDAYHTGHLHASISKLGLVPTARFAQAGYHVHAGNGHGLGLGLPAEQSVFEPSLLPRFRERLTAEQFDVLRQIKNMHGNIFPNLSFLISSANLNGQIVSHVLMKLWLPKGPGRIEVLSWGLVEKEAPPEWKDRSRQHYVLTFGPSGIFDQDDSETWMDITRNCGAPAAHEVSFFYLQGLGRPRAADFPGPGEVYESKYSENNARQFYRRWLELMTDDVCAS
jgi:phenylpropionate dioxygenase-like ring-hydroxylating dioxygenase large terminal subunit